MQSQSIVLLSSDDWGWKTSKYQLSMQFSRQYRVLFVSSIGFRAPTATRSDLTRLWRKLKEFLRGPRRVDENIWVLTPVIIPFGHGPFVLGLNRILFAVQYRLALRLLRLGRPYTFVFSPNWGPYVRSLRRQKLIYYCVDEQSGFKGVNARLFGRWDEQLTRTADHVFCSAYKLYLQKCKRNESTHYMPHGVNWSHFSTAITAGSLKPDPSLERLAGPVLLFFGHISYEWVDTELLRFIAAQRPDWHIALAGRNAVAADEFAQYPNIHLLGERDYEDLPSLCRYASAGIIPFVDSELTAACNPLKLYEYLAAGLPVVSTDIPEVRQFADTVYIGNSHEAFLAACEKALAVDRSVYSPKASELVRDFDWDHRVEKIYTLIGA
jgi:glycosyltransferase involved in cell wall biosynthesis